MTVEALENMRQGPPLTDAQRGQVIRRVLGDHESALNARTDQLYTAARAAPDTADVRPALADMGSMRAERRLSAEQR